MTWMSRIASAPPAISPSSQIIVSPNTLHDPWPGVTSTYVALLGRVSVRMTFSKGSSPKLWTVTWYVSDSPATTGSEESVTCAARSCGGTMGCHEGWFSNSELLEMFVGFEPFGSMVKIWRFLAQAIFVPSGDHSDLVSPAGSIVRFVCDAPFASIT